MIDAFDRLWQQTRPAFDQKRTFDQARTLALASLVGLGRRTVTGMLAACGRQDVDWSQAYRLFEQSRFDPERLFEVPRREVGMRLTPDAPLVVAMDDTLLRKRGPKAHGVDWRRDPLGPPFQTNLVRGQRFLQLCAALPDARMPGRARGVPIDFTHCPTPPKPKQNASAPQWEEYHAARKTHKLSVCGSQGIVRLRHAMDAEVPNARRTLIACVDGSFTNHEVFTHIPSRTTLIGRVRKDACLFAVPDPQPPHRGRRLVYGEQLPTPEQLRCDDAIPWAPVRAFAASAWHNFEIKTLDRVRWRGAGEQDLRLVVVRPLAYRLRKGSPLLYRQPAYLLCSDPDLPLEQLVQYYVWRWEIEVNHRDEKTCLGVGEAQVRTEQAVERAPQFLVAVYAMLLLAGEEVGPEVALALPKWRASNPPDRLSTPRMIQTLRAELWGLGMGLNKTDFVSPAGVDKKPVLIENALPFAVLSAFR